VIARFGSKRGDQKLFSSSIVALGTTPFRDRLFVPLLVLHSRVLPNAGAAAGHALALQEVH
jgi:hypothetical protein